MTNFGQRKGVDIDTGATVYAQGFTTGRAHGGYTLSGITVDLGAAWSDDSQCDTIRAELWASKPEGGPSYKTASLSTPANADTSDWHVTFAAPANTVLQPSTAYYLVIYTVGSYDMALAAAVTPRVDASAPSG